MTVFAIVVLAVALGLVMVFHALSVKDARLERTAWREEREALIEQAAQERAYLTQAVMARSLPELHGVSQPVFEHSFRELLDEDIPVGQ